MSRHTELLVRLGDAGVLGVVDDADLADACTHPPRGTETRLRRLRRGAVEGSACQPCREGSFSGVSPTGKAR